MKKIKEYICSAAFAVFKMSIKQHSKRLWALLEKKSNTICTTIVLQVTHEFFKVVAAA